MIVLHDHNESFHALVGAATVAMSVPHARVSLHIPDSKPSRFSWQARGSMNPRGNDISMEVTAISPCCLNYHDTYALGCQHSGHRECSFWLISSSRNQARPPSRTHTNHADHVHELYLSRPASAPMVSAGPRPVSPRSSPLFRVRGSGAIVGRAVSFRHPNCFAICLRYQGSLYID